ncbi:RHS repeat domain-containing protein [Motilimonas pumila]|uniref:RHS repeat domain-containing protein n=1 Tax=Motilimonas pumila TaxID=2303987 RepID=UPI0022B7D559|nr:RHS repeat-associated core domain-containing protein [Motilimonas pumila]
MYYYQLDHLGTPQEITDALGHTVWSVQYRAYGNVLKQEVEEIHSPLRFQGQYYDVETGLHYNRHRYYNPNTAAFLTLDPIGLAGGLNNYQYVPNPTGWIDPLGLANKKGDELCCGGDVPDSAGQKISEAGYLQRIERLESIYGSPNVHSLEKHGAETTGMKQYRRVQQEHYPNPTTGAPGNKTKTASKFLTNKDHYEAIRSAILQRKANPEINDFDIVMDRNIGVNIKNLGSHKNRGPYSADYTNTAWVRFDPNTGKMFTAFPIPEKK